MLVEKITSATSREHKIKKFLQFRRRHQRNIKTQEVKGTWDFVLLELILVKINKFKCSIWNIFNLKNFSSKINRKFQLLV